MPTALEMTSKERQNFIKGLRKPHPLSAISSSQRKDRERLLIRVRKAAEILKKNFGVKRVLLFGSLAHSAWFSSDSDVDLAIIGLTGDYWQAWKMVEEIIHDRCVDVIEMETAKESLLRAIKRQGIEL